MAHLKNLVVNGNSRTIGTVYASNYVGKVNGYIDDTTKNNTSCTWVPVFSNDKIQYRIIPTAYNNDPSTLSVKYATTAGSANAVAWNNVSGKPSTYTPSAHTHTIAQVTNLQSSLDGKATKSHTHAIGDISNLQNTINSINSNKADLSYVNNKINDMNYSRISLDGGNTANYPYHRFLSIQNLQSLWSDSTGIYLIDRKLDSGPYGIVKVMLRTNEKVSTYSVSAKWLVRSSSQNPADIVFGSYLHDGKLDVDVFIKCGQWSRTYIYNVLGYSNWTMINSNEVDDTTTSDRKTSTECYSSLADAGSKIHSAAYSRTGSASDDGSVFNASKFDGHSTSEYYLKTQTITLGDGTDLPSSYSGGNIFKNP